MQCTTSDERMGYTFPERGNQERVLTKIMAKSFRRVYHALQADNLGSSFTKKFVWNRRPRVSRLRGEG